MNRLLYQLSYAAMWVKPNFGTAEISFIDIQHISPFVKKFFQKFWVNSFQFTGSEFTGDKER